MSLYESGDSCGSWSFVQEPYRICFLTNGCSAYIIEVRIGILSQMFVATRHATKIRSSSNVVNSIRENGVCLLLHRKGVKLIFPDVLRIEAKLLNK